MSLRAKAFRAAEEGRFANSSLLKPFSVLFGLAAALRNYLYDKRILPITKLPVPVISVGNLVAGGVGKTPLVHFLAKNLPMPLAILSRGYRAKKGELGDEMKMLQQRLPAGARCYSGKDRVSLGNQAISEGAKLLILDDGFQYRHLHRDIDLLVIDSSNPFGYGDYLPRGLLRDSPKRYRKADAVIAYGKEALPFSEPAIRVELQLRRVVDCDTGKEVTKPPKQIGAFCAIAHPNRFFKTLEANHTILDTFCLGDHDAFPKESLALFALSSKKLGAKALMCTEKDAVKLEIPSDFPLPVLYLEMELQMISEDSLWEDLKAKILDFTV